MIELRERSSAALEAIEREAWIDCHAAADEGSRSRLGLAHAVVAGVALTAARGIDIGLLNRAQGMGSAGPTSFGDLVAASKWLADRCAPGWRMDFVPGSLPIDFDERMRRIGLFRKAIGSTKMHGRVASAPRGPGPCCRFPVRAVSGEDARACLAVVDEAFGVPESVASWGTNLVGRPGWRLFAAFDGEKPVAFGLMFIKGEWAWFGWGATAATHRRLGCQSALLHRRLAEGAMLGAKHFAVECATPRQDGDAAEWASYRNVLNLGFTPAYARVLYGEC